MMSFVVTAHWCRLYWCFAPLQPDIKGESRARLLLLGYVNAPAADVHHTERFAALPSMGPLCLRFAAGTAQSYAQRLEGALADKADEVSALRGQLAYAPFPDPAASPDGPQLIEAEPF